MDLKIFIGVDLSVEMHPIQKNSKQQAKVFGKK